MNQEFGEQYFVGKVDSNYVDYRLRKFDGLANDLTRALPIRSMDVVIDWGCATGALINSLRQLGIRNVKGSDISTWAIEWGRNAFNLTDNELHYYDLNLLGMQKDWVLALDVLEHCPGHELDRFLSILARSPPRKGLVIRVPVSAKEGEDFVLDVSKNDRTHVQIHDKAWWRRKLAQAGLQESRVIQEKHIYDSTGVYCAVFTKGGA